jgi:hypothetical protein
MIRNGKPRPGGRVRDAAVRGEGGQVQKLAGASGAEADEALERPEIADPQDVEHVPLHVGEEGVGVEILCDDRNIVRRMDDGWRVYGTWSHGDVNEAPCYVMRFDKSGEIVGKIKKQAED